jgi:hypothetical protein
MSHCGLLNLTALVLLAIPSAAQSAFGPGEAAGRSLPGRAVPQAARTADFKVLVWYRIADPVGTFKYEIYDVRKGEYTAKVDDWIKDVKTKYRGYYALVRDVDLKRETGETELLKVGSVISRELVVAASLAGIEIGSGRRGSRPPGFGVFGGAPSAGQNGGSRLNRLPGTPAGNRDYLQPSPTPFPVPVPFPHVPR